MKVRLSAGTAFASFALFLSIASVPALAQYNQCVWALNTSASSALSMSGSATISAPNCGVVVDSTSSSALSLSGSASLTANYIDVVGGYTKTGSAKASPTPVTGSAMPPAPLSFLVAPTSSSCAYTNVTVSGSGSETLSPGTYCNGITISGSAKVTFNPGTYNLMGGGLNASGSSTLTGTGVTFFLTQGLGYSYGSLTVSGSAKLTLRAPTCGSLEGILFYQDPGIGTGKAGSSFSGSASSTLEGALYFPTTGLTYSGSDSGNYLTVVANTITLSGSATIPDNYGGLCNAGPLAPPVAVSITPATVTLTGGMTQQFTATVSNANPSEPGVTWSISPSGAGSVSSSGLYTAPATIATQQTVVVTATSQADPTKSASATVTLMPLATPAIAWPVPAPITYGTPLSAAQLNATVGAPGTLTYSPAAGTVLSAGTHTLSVTFTPSNPNLYTTSTASVTLTVNKAVPVITWPAPAPITYGAGLSATQLDANANVAGAFVYSPVAGTVLNAGTQTLTATFTPGDTVDYAIATDSVALTVNQATPAITWGAPAPISYGTVLSSAQLDATANVAGAFNYSPAAGTVLAPGNQTLSVTFTPTNTTDYATVTATTTLSVNQATSTITWPVPAAITYGTALSAIQLDATANVGGTFTYSPAAGTVLPAGTQTLSVTFTPTNTTDYTAATASVMLTVNKATPVISWPALPAITYGTALGSTQLDATANVAGAFVYSPAAGAVLNAGTQTLTASFSPADAADYTPANASEPLTVNKSQLTVAASSPTVPYGSPVPTITPSYSGFVNGDTPSVLAMAPTCTTSYRTTTPAGSLPSTSCSGAAAANYAFTYVNGSVTITQASQTITFSAPASPVTYGVAPIALNASASSGLSVTFAADGPCLVSGTTVSITGAGTCTLIARQTGNSNYTAATPVSQSFIVNPASLTITASSATVTYGAAVPTIVPTYGGFVESDTVASLNPAPTCSTTYTATSAPGTYPSTCSGAVDANYAISYVAGAVTVNQGTSVITWAPPVAITYGTALSATQLNAAATVPGTFTYSPAAGTVLTAGNQILTATFTPTNTTDYTAATASVPLVVSQATPVITWATPAAIASGTALSSTQLDATANVPGTFVYSPAAGVVPPVGGQTLSVTFTPTDTTDYTTATASVTLTVNQSAQCNSNGYSYGRAITINHNLVPNTDQTNFPFLFNTTDPLLATTANGGHVVNPNGYDIIFTSDPAGQNPLPYEMEEYNPQSGTVIAWVQIPDLSHTSDTTIYLFYGNANITTSQQNPAAVWDSNYLGVWHVANNGGQLSLADSTSNQNNATNNGATVTDGQIDGGMGNNGTSYATVGTLANLEDTLQASGTYSVWVKPSVDADGGIFGENWPGWALAFYGGSFVEVELSAPGIGIGVQTNPGVWSYLTVTVTQVNQADGTQTSYATAYLNGVPVQSAYGNPTIDVQEDLADSATATTYLGLGLAAYGNNQSAVASEDEFRISNIARSPDWIATEYANQSSPSTFYNLSQEGFALSPDTVSLYQGQTQQFTATFPGSCTAPVSWSISPAGVGTIDQTGFYTAPATVATQQVITITATSGSTSASAAVTLIPPVAVSVVPGTALFANNGGEQQQFTATVVNTGNTAVTWSVSPAGAGTVDQTGLYTAPQLIANQQTVIVTATSQFDPTKSGSATITLTPPSLPAPICASNGYSFQRAIVINHNLVPNTDQSNFPFLFNTTDPGLATTANGGHVANINGNDIMFTADAAGQIPLNFEIEEYNPTTGQLIAWIGLSTLSHTTDTVIYLFYGNANISASQQNPTGVWDSNYMGVWHVANPNGQVSLADSTGNGDDATSNGATATPGQIDGGMSSLGYQFATIGNPANLANLTQGNATFSAWVNPAVIGSGGMGSGIIVGKGGPYEYSGWSLGVNNTGQLEFNIYDPYYFWEQYHAVSDQPLNSGWSYVAATVALVPGGAFSTEVTLYTNGAPSGSSPIRSTFSDDSSSNAYLAYNASGALDFSTYGPLYGSEDELRISNIVRSPDWIATEYANQSSPSTFYSLSAENIGIAPGSATLYQSQTQQFTDILQNACQFPVAWSVSPAGLGSITQNGLYTAPATIATQQTVTVTAANQTNSGVSASATVTLIPPVSVSVSPVAVTLNDGGQQQQFSATVLNTTNTAVTWSVTPSGIGAIDQTGLYTGPESVENQQPVTVTATSLFDPTKSASAVITFAPPSLPPACGSNGYSFVRAISINHEKVPNSDQTYFPFLFDTTDPLLAATVNGGHVTNFNGYDIMFSSDPAGQNPLPYELEEYNPATGKVIAWVQIPNLSHISDTTIYLFYGNPNITASQQNPAAVWDANYQAVWHLPNVITLSTSDSTSNANNASIQGSPSPISGEIWGGALFNEGSYLAPTSYISLSSGTYTLSTWFQTPLPITNDGWNTLFRGSADHEIIVRESDWTLGNYDNTTGSGYNSSGFSVSSLSSGWHYLAVVTSGSSLLFYVDGIYVGSSPFVSTNDIEAVGNYQGDGDQQWGSADDIRVSNSERSGDWIATEYANQSSPSTFYSFSPENPAIIPSAATIYAGQSQLFAVIPLTSCGVAVGWSGSPSGVGTLVQNGPYTASFSAPQNIAAPQTVSITATNQADGSTIGTSVVTLFPQVSVSIIPATPTLYVSGEKLQFTATLGNAGDNSVIWSVSPVGMGVITPSGLYSAPNFSSQQTVTITATSAADPTQSASATLTLNPLIVTPNNVEVFAGFTQQFTANLPVIWSIAPGGIGSIDQTGLYSTLLNLTGSGNFVVATVQADPNASVAVWVQVPNPIITPVTPSSVLLYGGQSQAFYACLAYIASNWNCTNQGSVVANWSVNPAGVGTVNSSGVYFAPLSIPTRQTVTISAASVGNPGINTSATVTLIPATISNVSPQSITLDAEQTQQFTATVTNSINTGITWTISPAGMGSISSSGLYRAPPYVASQQIVTVTAASQAVPSLTASAVITLSPTQCISKAYSFVRPIVVDHTRVPSSDQPNFPFYFAVTDPLLASTSNGGHVSSPSGNDIVFSSDPSGLQQLPFDLQQYNPATGQIAAWVKVPVLSHSQDTIIYMFYGDPAITAPQQNPPAVWDTYYTGVYQFGDLQSGILPDSTVYVNNASSNNVQLNPGQPDEVAGAFDGSTSYITLPTNDFQSYPTSNTTAPFFNGSFGVWFKTAASGVILGQTDGATPLGSYNYGYVPALYIDTAGYLRADLFALQNAQQMVSPTTLNDNNWHHAVLAFQTDDIGNVVNLDSQPSGMESLYVDGQLIGSQNGLVPDGYSPSYAYFLGTGIAGNWAGAPEFVEWFFFNGSLDQVEISSIARSGGWVQAEYNNQSSPSTFFALGAEAGIAPTLNPPAVTLYQSQSQQFTVLQSGSCNAGNAVWSMPAGNPGTLSPTGLYTAPATINTPQTITVTGATFGANSTPLHATITLMPPVSVSVTPGVASLPNGGTQQFTAAVLNTSNTGVTWMLNPVGMGSISATGLYVAPASWSGQQTVSVIATSLADPTQSASATVTLGSMPVPPVPIITLNPQTAFLYPGETQQFKASVTNSTDPTVIWSISPANIGSIDSNGLYRAPAVISAQQTVTVIATSQADSGVTASATIALAPVQCASNGYSYVRAITIDHTKVPNTDQSKFPFLFSTTDPLLATMTNGGHVANSNGYDMIFTLDQAGQNPLPYEVEQYNPATGQMIAWVQIPNLSHSSDTVIYLFYGNPAIATPQQNPNAVWDSNYGGVWHLSGNGGVVSTADSTANANNVSLQGSALVGPGEIGTAAVLNGSGDFDAGSQPSVQPTNVGTMSVWMYSESFPGYAMPIGNGSSFLGSPANGALLTTNGNAYAEFSIDDAFWGDVESASSGPLGVFRWYYLTGTWDGSAVNLYINGVLVSSTAQNIDASPAYDLRLGAGIVGSIEEGRVSGIARSADWIATEYANQSSPSTFFSMSAEDEAGITPNAVALYANQSQQFTSPGLCSAGVTWSLSTGAEGTLSSSGLYTAPDSINEQQTATVTATSVANPSQSASATVTLMPPVSVAVSPASLTLNQNQNQQFTATVSNSTNAAVTWTLSPAGLGSLDQNGGYLAPSSITTQQTVTITATSVTDPTKSASAMITLAPSTCASTGYGNQRVILIDHTKIPNTDQINFPFLFNTTDPDLATIDNGGHVANLNGYDIIFSSDSNGQTKLDFEIEQYNPVTGQLVAWIRIPTLSHSSDTVIYVFYGNSAITAPQANPAGVWDTNYQAVYHLGNLPSTEVASDSTNYANNASFYNFIAEPGEIDGSAGLDGITSYMQLPSTAFPNYPTGVYANLGIQSQQNSTGLDATFSIWFKTNSWGGLLDQTGGTTCTGSIFGFCYATGPEQAGDVPIGTWRNILDINFDGNLEGTGVGSSTQIYNDNNWHFTSVTFENGINKLYADGQLVSAGSGGTYGFSPTYAYFVGTEDPDTDTSSEDFQPWKYLPGQLDEINVSNTARSGDWIQTQFANQSSPSTFYKFYSPTSVQVAPSSISLYASQSELFTVPGTCDATIAWTTSTGSLGTLTSAGLYTAPPTVSSQQTVTVSATSQSNGASLGSAQVTLLPAPQPLTLVASGASPYQISTSQSFTATLVDPQGNPLVGVTVNFTVTGPNEIVGSASTSASGTASFTYTGANNGTDTVQATASVNGMLLTSNSLTAAWLTPPPAQAPTLTLLPQPSLGRGALMGAFTDSNGDLIEPIEIGTADRTFITPAGATQLQLGINDTYYEINGGGGFVVRVNGSNVNVPPTAMPWKWKTGGLNNNYQYSVNDGSGPVIAASSLTAGQPVTIAYQSGTMSTSYPVSTAVNANGDPSSITGTQIFDGAYFPTLYTTGTAYPQNQPINVFATVVDATGAPIPNTPVTLTVSGANPGQLQATTDATGTASFLYTGQYAGNDSLQAQATLAGQEALDSNQTTIDWTNYPPPPPVGSLSLNEIATDVNVEGFSAIATDASGNVLPNENVGFYISGADNIQTSAGTNNIGEAFYLYYHINAGVYNVIAVDSVDRNVIVTQPYTRTWTIPTGSPSSSGGTITIGIAANNSVAIPNPLQLTGTVTDNSGLTPTLAWTQISGPGTVTFGTPTQANTTATFSQVGTYVLELSANDTVNSGWAQFTVNVLAPSVASQAQGWIGSPAYGATVSGVVPITLAPGVTLASGTLTYAPANNPNSTTVLNANVSGSGQIALLDTTALANGSYLIQMQGTDTNSNSQYSLILVTVTGNYKPGRVTTTVTDLVVPATGLPIQIQRTYDSLNASTSGDFGYGWNLSINTQLTVDNSGNVTFTIGGQRKTFYLTPTYGGWLFPWYSPAFTPQPGAFGTLADTGSSCPLDFLVPNGSIWDCYGGSGQYTPSGYVYTDPSGTQYTMSAGGQLQSIVDRSGNGLTISPNGITSTTGLNVPFVRDSQNRITQITDPAGNVYSYGYDANGNLASVTYPTSPSQPSTYTYDQNHFYLSGTDFRNNPLPTTSYYAAGEMDASGNYSVAGKLQSVTDAMGNTTSYIYNLATNTTVITYPPDANGNVGTATMVYDTNGDVLSSTDPLGHTTTNTYDSNFNLLSTTDPLGHTTSYTYDAAGNKTSKTYPSTVTSTNTTSTANYNQFGEIISAIDENGDTHTFNYDANYNLQTVTDSLGTLMSAQFNAGGQMISGAMGVDITQNPARAAQFTYDANGNLASKTDALGNTTSYTYNALGQKITMTEPIPSGSTAAQATTTYTYDALGNVTQTQAPLGRTTSSTYDANGNKLSDTDARGNITNYKYDALNRLIETDYPDLTKATKTYDFRNNVVTETDQNGNMAKHVYDLAGREISVTQAYGTASATTTRYAYDNAGRMTSQTDALGHSTGYTYDAAGNLLSVTKGYGTSEASTTSYAYDNARNKISQTDGNGNATSYEYDARKQLTETNYPDGTKKTNAYNGVGSVISVTDQAGNQVQYNYDAANQLINVVQVSSPDSNANTTIYGYNANGNPIVLEDANQHTTTNAFDLLSELTQKVLPDGTHTETRTYDSNGNLATVTHFNGVTTTYTYDQLNRLLSRATPGEATVSFTYTATGRRQTMTDGSGTTTYSYDSMDRLMTKATPEGTLSYTYDAAGNLASMTSNHAHGVSATYSYDGLDRLNTVADTNLTGLNTTTYSYDNANNVVSVTYPNGAATQLTYDLLNRITGLSSQPASYTYQRGPAGNLIGAQESGGRTARWNYDGIYRLTNETISLAPSGHNGSVGYSLDPVGNRLSDISSLEGISSGSWGYNSDDEASSESYDANGNVTATGGKTFAYDAENHLTSTNGGTVSIVYDGDGNRVAKTVNGVTTYYLFDDLNPTGYSQVVEELSGAGTVERQYTYGLQRISENQMLNSTWTPSFYGYDGGGSVRQLTNSAGAVTDTYEYDAFGNALQTSSSTPNVYLYRGEQYDQDLGLYYLRARYYDPVTGRFMSRDPLDPQPIDAIGEATNPRDMHKYLYAGSDPVNWIDPTGRGEDVDYGSILKLTTLVVITADLAYGRNGPSTIGCDAIAYLGGVYLGVRYGAVDITYDFANCKAIGRYPPDSPPTVYPLPFPFPLSWSEPRGPYKSPGSCDPGEDWHHIVPQGQGIRQWAEECGIPLDSPGFGMCLPRGCHQRINGNSNGTNWQAAWINQINNVWGGLNGECPSTDEVILFARYMLEQFAGDLTCQ